MNAERPSTLVDLVKALYQDGRCPLTLADGVSAFHDALGALCARWEVDAKNMAQYREYDIEGTLEDCAAELRAILGDKQ